MSVLNNLKNIDFWREFLEYKISGKHMSSFEEKDFKKFVDELSFFPIATKIESGQKFTLPKICELNKKFSTKKRRVFVFDREENYVLKAVAYLLNKYDCVFPENVYSFRRNIGVKKAIHTLVQNPDITECYSYKVDIKDYFNSVDTDEILLKLEEVLCDDEPLYKFISQILTEPKALFDGKKVHCKKGIMAGVPLSGFLANLYLKELDEWFVQRGAIYARYSDDIIVFAKTEAQIAEYENKIKDFLACKKLEINEEKEYRTQQGQSWEFLGFCISTEGIDLSEVALDKVKDKMRRKARALVRWKKRTGADSERAMQAFIRHFNKKLFDNPNQHEITWCRWYFPTITTSESLKILDEYMIACIRYIATGKHTKSNYNLKYEQIKKMGYKNLVNAYYRYKKTNSF